MPRGGANRKPTAARQRYFELVRQGLKGAAAARQVGVSTSCGSKWFIEAGSMIIPDTSVAPRFLTQDDRIAIADGLRAEKAPAAIAAAIGKSTSTVYREIGRGGKGDGSYDPWWAHNQALLRRQRPKTEKIREHAPLRSVVRDKLDKGWSPQQISRYLRRQYPDEPRMHACPETIYRGPLLRNSFRYAARQDWDKIARVLKPVYTAATEEAALDRFAEFADVWGKKYPAIVRLWENAWEEFTPFLRFDTEIRRIVCTTNAIESVNARIRRAVKARGHFPNEQAALKCIYMAIMSLDPTGKGQARWTMRWKTALNAFDITFDGRLSAARQ